MTVRTTRRNLLRSATATSLAIPFLGAAARSAQGAGAPRRLIIVATPNATVMNRFWPADGTTYAEAIKPLEPLRSKILVMRGINANSAYTEPWPPNHEPDFANALTARNRLAQSFGGVGGISIDQHIASGLKGQTKIASLGLSTTSIDQNWPLVATGPGQPVAPQHDPQKTFSSLMGAVTGVSDPSAALLKVQAERKSVLDFLKNDISAVRCRIASRDRDKLDAHLASIREVERSLSFQKAVGGSCKRAQMPGTDDSFPAASKTQLDLIVMAMSCDLTRVVVFQWEGSGSERVHSQIGINSGHHAIAHGMRSWDPAESLSQEEQADYLTKIDAWYADQIYRYLCKPLAETPGEDGRPLLDSCAVLWIHEQATGSHSRKDYPCVLMGSGGGYFKTGQFMDFLGREENSLASHNNLLIELALAMGVQTPTFGDPRFSNGGFPQLRA